MAKNKNNKNMQSFVKDSFIYLPSKIIEGLMGIVALIYYTRWFVPEEYGEFSLIITIIGFSTTLFLGWISHSTLRYYGNNQKNKQFVSALFILIIIMILSFVLISFGLMFFVPLINKYYLYFISLFVLSGLWLVLQNMLRAARKASVYSTLISFSQIFKFLLTLILVKLLNIGVEALFISTIIFDIILIVVSLKYLNIKEFFELKLSKSITRDIVSYGFPLVGVALMSWLLQSSDRIMIGMMRNASEVGMYTIAYTIVSQPFSLILTSIMISAYPILIKIWEHEGRCSTEETIKGILRYFFILVVPAIVGLILLRKEIFSNLVGIEYYNANTIIPWVALGLLFMGLTQYANKVWELTEKTKMILYLTGIAGATNIILNLIFIPWLGYEGAAITTLLAYLVYFVVSTLKGNKHLKISFDIISLLKVVFATMIMAVAILFTKQYISSVILLIGMIVIYGLVYIILLLSINEGRTEAKNIYCRIRKR